MAFGNVIASEETPSLDTKTKTTKLSSSKVGCQYCPLNRVSGVNKVFGTVEGRDIFLWAQSPNAQENRTGKELVGPAGSFLWTELKRVGITRDMCDIQNVLRCYPADRVQDSWPPLKGRNPTKEELHCCSLYTKQAIEKQKAKLHLVFGEIAQKALLGAEYKKDRKSFWSERLKAYVVCLSHPAYFIRMGYGVDNSPKPNAQLIEFRQRLDYTTQLMGMASGQYAYLKEMEYVGITSRMMADTAYKKIKLLASKGIRVAVDVEDGILNSGSRRILCVGFSPKAGVAYVFPIYHQTGLEMGKADRAYNLKIVCKLLNDPEVKKVFHHGSYDQFELFKLLNVEVQAFDYDTEFGEYFFNPDAKAFGLQAIADRRYPEFSGYKEIVAPEAMTPEFIGTLSKNTKLTLRKKFEIAKKKNALNMALVPWSKIVLYNGADCDLTKRVEVSTKKIVNLPLMHVYRDASIMLSKMEKDGPLFDYRQHRRLEKLYPIRVQNTLRQLQRIARAKEFNPASPVQVKSLLFDKLELMMPGQDKPNTRAETLELMTGQHKAVQLILDFRTDAKIESTYLKSFKLSADMHEGKLTTKWWLVGCLPAGELVLTNRGYIPVEDVEIGDSVLSHEGREKKVIDVLGNGIKPIYRVTLTNGMTLRTTGNHPYFTDSKYKWVRADKLRVGERVFVYGNAERWKRISEYTDYRVSTWGRVYSEKSGRCLSLITEESGNYQRLGVRLWKDSKGHCIHVHRLVAETFLRNTGQGTEVRHWNGYAWDNTVQNLMWGTRKDNWEDAKRHGTSVKSKIITNDVVQYIRSLEYKWGSDSKIARNLGISRESVRDIRNCRYRLTPYEGKRAEFKLSEIVRIELLPPEMTYGLTVEGDESHVTMGVVTHNTRTGRMSSGKGRQAESEVKGLVNLQNIISDSQLQDMVISDEGWRDVYDTWLEKGPFTEDNWQEFEDLDVLLGFDEAQFEIRVVAQRSGDKELIAAFERGDDIHAEVGSKLIGMPYESLLDEGPERVAIKGVHFGIIYGLKGKRLAANVNAEYKRRGIKDEQGNIKTVTEEWANDVLEKYFTRYWRVKQMIEGDQKQAERLGYVETMLGFRRPINVEEQKQLGELWQGAYWANQAANTPIQGTAHQLLLLGLVNVIRQKDKYSLLQRPKMEVHDAMYFYVKLKNIWDARKLGVEMLEMEPVRIVRKEFGVDWRVPLKVEPKAGFRFGVMAKALGMDKGPKTTSDFLNTWCEKNKKVESQLKEEFQKLKNSVETIA